MTHGLSENDIADLTGVAKKALKFDFYIFRKAYGSYYAVWATAITLFVFLPYLSYYPSIVSYVPYILLTAYLTVFFLAFWITGRIFRRAIQIIGFKSILVGKRKDSFERKFFSSLSIIMFIVIILIISFYGINNIFESLIFYSFLIFMSIYQLKNLMMTFEKIPVEGMVSLVSFVLSIILSLLSIFVGKSELDFSLSWLPVIIGWYFSAVYAIYSSKKFLGE